MKNWFESYPTRREHRNFVNEAVAWWKSVHPGHRVDRLVVTKEYAAFRRKPSDWLLLSSKTAFSKAQGIERVNASGMICPECGADCFVLDLPPCRKANPEGYSVVFSCSECLYHFFSKSKIIDIVAAVKRHDLTGIHQVRGKV